MTVRRLDTIQPEWFAFTPKNLAWAKKTIAKYPEGKQASAVIPLLWRAQEQHEGWLPEPAMRVVAEMLGMAYIRVYEIATFYTMFQLSLVGKTAHVQVCGTTPCMLRGAEDIKEICKRRISERPHQLTEDGEFSWEEVECLGVCVNAPMVQIWKDTYEDLTPESFEALLDDFERGEKPEPGPQTDRQYSAPQGGLTTLTDPSLYNGNAAAESADDEPISDELKPEGLDAPREGKGDDLKRISGVGAKIEKTLNGLGIFHYDQIANWSPVNAAWVDDFLSFKGRIEREDWIGQAEILAQGGDTEFAKRVDAGEVETSTKDDGS